MAAGASPGGAAAGALGGRTCVSRCGGSFGSAAAELAAAGVAGAFGVAVATRGQHGHEVTSSPVVGGHQVPVGIGGQSAAGSASSIAAICARS